MMNPLFRRSLEERVAVASSCPLARADEAFRELMSGQATGKIAITAA